MFLTVYDRFLEYIRCIWNIIRCTPEFMEENSVLVGVITALVASSLFMRKYIRQKRAEAFFGFYAKLSIYLNELRTSLEDDAQLETSNKELGNIFTLLYAKGKTDADDYQRKFCPSYCDPGERFKVYEGIALNIKELLIKTDTNVYPKGVDSKKWYEKQFIIYHFCEFLVNEKYRRITNKEREAADRPAKHIERCQELIEAFDYIQDSINRARY